MMMKKTGVCRVAALLLTCVLLFLSLPLTSSAEAVIEVGDYLFLGEYQGETILWRCVAIRDDGPLMVSDRVLTYKAFDASEVGIDATVENPDDVSAVRGRYGSNEWSTSTLRQWLNSAGEVNWEGQVPDAAHVTANPYADEPGFVSSFTEQEMLLVKTVRNKAAVNEADAAAFGTEAHEYSLDWRIENVVGNYADAFAQYTVDRFFCINAEEIAQLGTIFDGYYEVAAPTDWASAECDEKYLDNKGKTYYWLRDAVGDYKYPEAARVMYPGTYCYMYSAYNGNIGVRPAFVMDTRNAVLYGNGSIRSPYTIDPAFEYQEVKEEDIPTRTPEAQKKEYVGTAGVSSLDGAYASIAIGDYVTMGTLDGEPILWRCVDIDATGPLMLSDRMLRFLAFDATGDQAIDPDGTRAQYGSNLWSTSTLRYWLNSDLGEWGDWEGVGVPDAAHVYDGYSPYDKEAGFLTSFSQEERAMMLTVSIESLLNVYDTELHTAGSEVNNLRRKITMLDNYAESYRQETTDTVFLMNRVQANTVYRLFDDYILGFPTAHAVSASDYKGVSISEGKSWHYWLRDAFGGAEYPYYTMDITADGRVSSDLAYSGGYGVRPAFYLNMETLVIAAGEGTEQDPYAVRAHMYGEEIVLREPTCDMRGKAKRECALCGEEETYWLDVTEHRFERETHEGSLFVETLEIYRCSVCGMQYEYGGQGTPVLFATLVIALGAIMLLCAIWIRRS